MSGSQHHPLSCKYSKRITSPFSLPSKPACLPTFLHASATASASALSLKMVQRKVPTKLGIKPHHLKSDTHLRPSSPPSPHHLKKIMKKPRGQESPKKRTHEDGQVTPPNYMKSTTSFEARKENKVKKTHTMASGNKGSSLKVVRTLTKTPGFKPSKTSVVLCEDLDAQRPTCSSTLKDTKFPSHLQLSPGGTSEMKVCPYTYCSLNGHHHAPLPPLRGFMSARRRALKSFKLGCLSPRQTKPLFNNNDPEADMVAPLLEEESTDFFVEIYSQDLECSEMDWEEGFGSVSCLEDFKSQEIVCEEKTQTTGIESLYDQESMSSGSWLEEDGDSEYQQTEIDNQHYDAFEVSSTTSQVDVDGEMNKGMITGITELQGLPIVDQIQDIKCKIELQQEEASHESKSVPENLQDGSHTTIIYNIIQFNISVFVNGEKTEHTEADEGVTTVANDKMQMEKAMASELGEQGMSNDSNNLTTSDEAGEVNEIVLNGSYSIEKQDKECNECDKDSESLGLPVTEQGEDVVEEQASRWDEDTTNSRLCKERTSSEEQPGPSINIKRREKPEKEMEDSREFNPRGPNFLPEVADPDAETVDLRHQMVDERKNAEEWMVDFALQQAVTTLAPARKRKVALLVEAFEKVMPLPLPIPKYNRHTPKAFTNARPMQACS